MLEYIKTPGKLSCLEEFKRAVKGYETVKVQCVGPATLIKYGSYNENEAVRGAYEHISSILDGLDVREVILFLDEPVVGVFELTEDTKRTYRELWQQILARFNVVSGIHNCGDINKVNLFDTDIDIISFDASRYDIAKNENYRNGKRIAWGIESKKDIKDFREGDLLTMPCGMGGNNYRISDCEKSLEKLLNISKEL